MYGVCLVANIRVIGSRISQTLNITVGKPYTLLCMAFYIVQKEHMYERNITL